MRTRAGNAAEINAGILGKTARQRRGKNTIWRMAVAGKGIPPPPRDFRHATIPAKGGGFCWSRLGFLFPSPRLRRGGWGRKRWGGGCGRVRVCRLGEETAGLQ